MLDAIYPVFPPEIFDNIIHFSADDHTVLAATSLVCSNWVPASRRHFFHTVTFRPSTLQDFQSLLSGPHHPTFLHHIRHIIFANNKVDEDTSDSLTASDNPTSNDSIPSDTDNSTPSDTDNATPSDTNNATPNDNLRPTPPEPIHLNQDLLSWFPTLPSVFSITFDAIKWESQDILSRFGSLIPCAKGSKRFSIRANKCTFDEAQSVNQILQAFPLLERLVCGGRTDTPRTLQRIGSLPKPVSDRLSVCRLKSLLLIMNEVARDEFIRTIPLGSVQLDKFKFQMRTDENPTRLHNLLIFLRQHCRNVSFLHINIYRKRTREHSQERRDEFNILISEFVQFFSEFRKLSTLEILVKAELDCPKLPDWVYPALEALPSHIYIENLRLIFWDPEYFESDASLRPMLKDAEHWVYFDWSVLKHILAQSKFRSCAIPVVMYNLGQAPELFLLPNLVRNTGIKLGSKIKG